MVNSTLRDLIGIRMFFIIMLHVQKLINRVSPLGSRSFCVRAIIKIISESKDDQQNFYVCITTILWLVGLFSGFVLLNTEKLEPNTINK